MSFTESGAGAGDAGCTERGAFFAPDLQETATAMSTARVALAASRVRRLDIEAPQFNVPE
jgi:hypothetical protein